MRLPDNQFEPTEHEQKDTIGLASVMLPDFYIEDRPQSPRDIELATPDQAAILLRTAQSIVFHPTFRATDHIFYGDTIESEDIGEGFPTVRPALIDGANFHLRLVENFNWESFEFSLHIKNGGFLHLRIKPQGVDTDSTTASWVQDKVLAPLLSEIMLKTQGSEDESDYWDE